MHTLILESMTDAVSVSDEDGYILYTNPAQDRIFGYERGALIGRHVTELNAYPPEDDSRIVAQVDHELKARGAWTGEWRNRRKDGAEFSTFARITAIEIGGKRYCVCVQEEITERKQREERLRRGDELARKQLTELEHIYQTAPVGLLFLDPDLRYIRLNERMAEINGLPVSAHIGRRIQEVLPELAPQVDPMYRQVLTTREPILNAEMTGTTPAQPGVKRRFLVSYYPVLDGPTLLGVTTVVEDVTAKSLAEDAQRAVERQLTLLIEASGKLLASPQSSEVLKAILDLAHDFIDADAYSVWRKTSGSVWEIAAMRGLSPSYSRTAFQADPRLEMLPSEPMVIEDVEAAPILANRREAHRAEGIRSMIMVPLRMQGSTAGTIVFYYRARHSFTNLDARVVAALGNLAAAALETAESYTRETRLKELAQSAERRANFLAEVGRVLSSALNYEVTLASVAELSVPAFSDWASVDILTPEGEVRRVAVKHTDPAKVELAYEFARRFPPSETDSTRVALRTGKSVLLEEIVDSVLEQQIQDPERLKFIRDLGLKSVIIVPLVANERSFGVLSFVTSESGRRYTVSDLWLAEEIARRAANAVHNAQLFTESKIAQEALRRSNTELQRANEDLNQFAYSASHDLQEPLRMVAVFSQLLSRKYKGHLDAEADDYIAHTVEGARRMETLLNDLLAYTRVANIATQNIAPTNLGKVLRKVMANLKAAIDESGAKVTYSEESPSLLVQEIHLVQLFQNVIGNAIKYRRDENPRINVTFERQGTHWKMCVADNGIGIPAAYREQIFGLFRRLHTVEKYPGTGVGLAICQKIVERYGGKIWVESDEGRGATFCFTLPAADDQ